MATLAPLQAVWLAAAALLCAAVAAASDADALPLCATAQGVDFSGHDILPPNPPAVTDGQACCAKCAAHGGCVAFSYALDSGTCYLKSAVPARPGANSDRLSGWVNSTCDCSAATPSPPPCWSTPHPCGHRPPPGPPPSPPPPPGQKTLDNYRCLPGTPSAAFPFCDKGKTAAERVALVVGNLTADEMVAVVLKQPVPRLDIPAYAMWAVEALHGVRLWPERCPFADNCTTIFPAASASSRAFNRTLWRAIGRAIGTEGRVLFNAGVMSDLSLRGPQVNIQHDPRWGRNSNSPSEDPLLTGAYGYELVMGTQSPLGGVNLISSQMKHWTAYGVEANRFGFNSNISVHDLAETYMQPLHIMLGANVSAAMCAYDAINGTPSCANGWMSDRVLRQQWGWQGVIESDCGALKYIETSHKYTSDGLHTAAAAMNGTCDVECDSVYQRYLANAHGAGLVTTAQLAAAARRILAHRFALGLFDDPRAHPYYNGAFNDTATVHSAEHSRLALEAARQTVVVVQNPQSILPLRIGAGTAGSNANAGGNARTSSGHDNAPDSDVTGNVDANGADSAGTGTGTAALAKAATKIALIGPLGNITDAFLGDYRPAACPGKPQPAPAGTACLPTLLDVLQGRVNPHGVGVAFASGCVDPPCESAPELGSVAAAMNGADVVVVAVGEKVTDNDSKGNTGGEGHDRDTIALPGHQAALVTAAVATGKPVVLLVLSGGSVSIDAAKGAGNVAVVYAGFGGESGPEAIADVLLGDAPASGRLPWTVYPESWGAATPMGDMAFQAGQGRSYKYIKVEPLFEFAAGLSYTTFELTPPPGGPIALGPTPVPVCANVANTGSVASPVVVTLFAAPAGLSSPPRIVPSRRLVDFDRVGLAPGASARVCFDVADADVALVDDSGATIAFAGRYTLVFFDGATKVNATASVAVERAVATVPPPDNPVPPCCSGDQRTCC